MGLTPSEEAEDRPGTSCSDTGTGTAGAELWEIGKHQDLGNSSAFGEKEKRHLFCSSRLDTKSGPFPDFHSSSQVCQHFLCAPKDYCLTQNQEHQP